jgi:hypothetical protein
VFSLAACQVTVQLCVSIDYICVREQIVYDEYTMNESTFANFLLRSVRSVAKRKQEKVNASMTMQAEMYGQIGRFLPTHHGKVRLDLSAVDGSGLPAVELVEVAVGALHERDEVEVDLVVQRRGLQIGTSFRDNHRGKSSRLKSAFNWTQFLVKFAFLPRYIEVIKVFFLFDNEIDRNASVIRVCSHTGLSLPGDLVVSLADAIVVLELLGPDVGRVVLGGVKELSDGPLVELHLGPVVGDAVDEGNGAARVRDRLLHVVEVGRRGSGHHGLATLEKLLVLNEDEF